MMKKYQIQVRQKGTSNVLKVIKRKIRVEAIGNFCPAFCTYLNKEHLVKSDGGDLSDPFRQNKTYLSSLFIEVA